MGIIGRLFDACLKLFIEVLNETTAALLKKTGASIDLEAFECLHYEAERFALWGDSFDARDGELDNALAKSTPLRKIVLEFLNNVGETLVTLAISKL